MTTAEGSGGSDSFPYDEDVWDLIHQWGDVGALDLSPKVPHPSELSTIERLTQVRPSINTAEAMADISGRLKFEERYPGLVITNDPIGLVRRLPDGRLEKYLENHIAQRLKGKSESADYGIGFAGNQKTAVFLMNWEFMGGSLGVVAGEKFQRAADLATDEKIPLIALFASGGARQQENKAGLVQMERMVEAIRKFKTSTELPYISVLVGEVWGGVSASAVPLGDITIALAGSNYGFSGPRVIETYQQGVPVPKGAQTVENNLLNRNIDVIVSDTEELEQYIKDFLRVSRQPKKQAPKGSLPELRLVTNPKDKRVIHVGKAGIASALYDRQTSEMELEIESVEQLSPDLPEDQMLMKIYESYIRSASRIDSEFVIRTAFGDAVPLYNHYIDMEKKVYPAIIAAVGRIGIQPFLVIGNQPSYSFSNGRLKRLPATPAPRDFEYDRRMLQLGARLRLPLVRLVDTLGAEPTTASEENGQSRSIANTLYDNNAYPMPVFTVVLGALGSGGGLAGAPRGEYRAMMSDAMAYVAEPTSASSILYKKAQPEVHETLLTLSTMSAQAQDQLRQGLIDEVIPVGKTPLITAKNIHDALAKAYAQANEQHFRRRKRSSRIRSMRGFKLD